MFFVDNIINNKIKFFLLSDIVVFYIKVDR